MLGDQDSQFQWFEFETRMRKLIKDVIVTYDLQIQNDEKRIVMIEKEMNENEIRLKEIEFLLYKSEDKQSRFDDIHKIITQMETERRKDINVIKAEQEEFRKMIFDKVFVYESKLRQVDTFEQMLNGAIKNYEAIDEMIKGHKVTVMEELTTNLVNQNELLKQKSEEVSQATQRIIKIEPKLTYFSQEILKLEQVDRRQGELLDKMKQQIQDLQTNKFELKEHIEFKDFIEDKLRTLTENYGSQIDRMLNNENYLEKYTPIFTQRMINDTLEQILQRKQKKKLIKYNEIKMPLLLQPIFEDVGVPNLLQLQKKFHHQVMNGLISDQQKFVQTAMVDDKERTKVRWQIQNTFPPVETLQQQRELAPIKNAMDQLRQSTLRRSSVMRQSEQASVQGDQTSNSHQQHARRMSKRQSMLIASRASATDTIYYPKRSDYKGPYDINDPKVLNMLQASLNVSDEERKDELLKELYKSDDNSQGSDKEGNEEVKEKGMQEGIMDEDDGSNDRDSFDFEQQLKKDISAMVAEKLENNERRLKYLIETHEGQCKDEFKMYEIHIKEQVSKMTAYVQEVHANHIAEINNFKKEKNEQLIVNQMLVKKVQGIELWKTQQLNLNDQYQTFGHCLENFVSIFKAIEMADNSFVMNFENSNDEGVTLNSNKEFLSGSNKKNAFTTQSYNERSNSQTSNFNLHNNGSLPNGGYGGGLNLAEVSLFSINNDYNNINTSTGQNQNANMPMNIKKLVTDRNVKQFSESTLQAIQHVLQRKRNFLINIINHHTGDQHKVMRNDLYSEYKKIEELVESAINNINLIKEGEHTKVIKKNIFQISKTRQPSPTTSDDEMAFNRAMDQRLNGSVLVQGSGPGVLGPKLNKLNLKEVKSSLNQTLTQTQAGLTLFSSKRQSQNPSSFLKKKTFKNPSRIEEGDNNNMHFHTLSGMTPTHLSFTNKKSKQSIKINQTQSDLGESSVQMPTLNNSIYNQHGNSIMIQDGSNSNHGLPSALKIEKISTLPQINSALKKQKE